MGIDNNVSSNKSETSLYIPTAKQALEIVKSWNGRCFSKTIKRLDHLVKVICKCLLGLTLFAASPLSASAREISKKVVVEHPIAAATEKISSSTDFKNEIIVRSLTPDDWESFRDLRLKALSENPIAYGIAVSDESIRSDEEWKSICESAYKEDGKWYFVAEYQGKLIGIVGAHEQYGSYMRHLVEIVGAYVVPEFRRTGVMSQLSLSLKNRLLEAPHVERLISWVTLHEHQSGKHISEYFGFQYAGKISQCIKYKGQYYDCCWLEASLKPPSN